MSDFPLELFEYAEIMLNSTTTAATDPTGSSLIILLVVLDLFIAGLSLRFLFKKLRSPGMDSSSSSDVFMDAYEYLPEGMDSCSSDEERPQTPEPTPDTDPAESTDCNMQKVNMMHATLLEGMNSSSAQPSTSAAVLSQERPQTPGQEPTPATDALETEPMFDYAQPSTSAAVLSERKLCNSPTDAPAQNNSTGARSVSDFSSDREPSQERPQTPEQEPTPAKATDLTLMFPNKPRLQKKYFQCFYKVGKKLGYDDRVHKGIRRSDGRKVAIKFVDRHRLLETLEMPEFAEEGATLLKLQKPPMCEHIIRLYDRFIMEDKYILIMERFPACVTLSEFIRRNKGGLTEETVTHIMWQIFVTMSHCMDHGAFMIMCRVTEQSILINPKTLQIKFADFDEVYFPRSENNPHESSRKFYFLNILNSLINEISHPPGKGEHLSRECLELGQQLNNLENMFE